MFRRRRSSGATIKARWRMLAVELEATVLGLLVLVQQSAELRCNHPLHEAVENISPSGGSFIGLVMAYPGEEAVLQASGLFLPNSDFPFVELAGRRFNIGTIRGVDVIYVMTGEKTVNAGVTVQILLDLFDVVGVVHYGIAGSTNDSLLVGDVSVPNYVAFTSSWNWKEFRSKEGQQPEIRFGAYNFPWKGENLLAKVEFRPVQLFSNGRQMEELFWLPIDPYWFNISTRLQELDLQQCLNETHCLPNAPKVAYGLKASTADVFLDNGAYSSFLFKEFNISTADEESAAVVMVALSNGVPCVVFRGVSDVAGVDGTLSLAGGLSTLAAINALRVAVEFIELINSEITNSSTVLYQYAS
ncbi:hypothetical protein Nepgr_010953 [Nepenthes gracilis]|uniref:Nucleoside phosphorylase domain-containing protein n=1 Tax=Nepenthes gracilis TaxID=150966 RepID=A0AAD3SDD3_NEPGR|nr:hypothetical protein Nepgr_010953 [Nepenthes gracilis]